MRLLLAPLALTLAGAALAAPSARTTLEDLKTAFQSETSAQARYLAYARRAVEEGNPGAARLFRAAARSDQVHAGFFGALLKELGATASPKPETVTPGTTRENLLAALEGEILERDKVYPAFVAQARKEGNGKAAVAFKHAQTTDVEHVRLFQAALGQLEELRTNADPYFVCPVCGYTSLALPSRCPSSGTGGEKFERVE